MIKVIRNQFQVYDMIERNFVAWFLHVLLFRQVHHRGGKQSALLILFLFLWMVFNTAIRFGKFFILILFFSKIFNYFFLQVQCLFAPVLLLLNHQCEVTKLLWDVCKVFGWLMVRLQNINPCKCLFLVEVASIKSTSEITPPRAVLTMPTPFSSGQVLFADNRCASFRKGAWL